MTCRTGAALVVKELSAGYPGRPVLTGLSLGPLQPGQVTALVGPNAAGKSTLLMALAGLLKATGTVRIGNADLLTMSGSARASQVAFMPQTLPQGVALSVLESVMASLRAVPMAGFSFGAEEVQQRAITTLERLDITPLALEDLDRLSGGQRQLVSLAQALVREPNVLLLDEPTSALDLRHQATVMSCVRQLAVEGRVIVVVMHDLNLAARWADNIAVLHEGKVHTQGEPAKVFTPDMLAEVYGVVARIDRSPLGHTQVSVEAALPNRAHINWSVGC